MPSGARPLRGRQVRELSGLVLVRVRARTAPAPPHQQLRGHRRVRGP